MNKIEIPERLINRPRYRGLPIPYIALIKDDGQPDFRVTDEVNRRLVIIERHCQLCGEKLGRYIFFVGGTEAAKSNRYFEPAAHLECVIYAMQVCPFIIGRIEHEDPDKIQAQNPEVKVMVNSSFTTFRNPYWVIKKALGYDLEVVNDTEILIIPKDVIYETEPLHAETMNAESWERISEQLIKGGQII